MAGDDNGFCSRVLNDKALERVPVNLPPIISQRKPADSCHDDPHHATCCLDRAHAP